MRLSVPVTPDGACQAPLWSQPPISALRTMPFLTTLEAGATLLFNTSISLNLYSNTLLSTEQGLCLLLTEGKTSKPLKQSFKIQGMYYTESFNLTSFGWGFSFVGYPAGEEEA